MKMQGQKWKCKDENENARTKMKMQGRHKKLFLGSLRASRAIKNHPPHLTDPACLLDSTCEYVMCVIVLS